MSNFSPLAPILIAALGSAAPAAAQTAPGDPVRGEAFYMNYCVACHGIEARGEGPMTPILMIRPTDLTRLAATNDGVFPTFRVIARIDGRDPLVAHGSPMPVYGDFFEGRGVTLRPPRARRS
jgi:hypothetical protein